MQAREEVEGMETSVAPENGIGRRLRAARQRCGWSREALAFHSGISWSAIAQVESGRRRNLRPGTLVALAGALGVTIDYLVTGRSPAVPMLEHQALLYGSDSEFTSATVPFLAEALERSEAAIVVTGERNAELLRDALGRQAERVEFAEQSGWYRTPMDAVDRYRAFLQASLDAGAPWVRVIGEPVWAGRSEPETRMWTRYEALLNLVFSAEPATVLCPYDTRTAGVDTLDHARITHPQTIDGRTLATSPEYADPTGSVLEP
jgi:transcriptional regulator with XRE-family HTH domain